MAATIQWDYSIEDAKDDTGVDDNNIVGDEEEIWNTPTTSRRKEFGFLRLV